MNKTAKRTLAMTAIIGTGFASWMMYKKKHPKTLENAKMVTKETFEKC